MSTTGILTEREWRRQASRSRKASPRCWGAQCMLPQAQRKSLTQDRAFHAFLILLSLVTALFMPALIPKAETPAEYPEAASHGNAESAAVRSVSAIGYERPADLYYYSQTYTREQLLRGKMLLNDRAHPLPAGVPAPNTLSVATYGKGMVPVGDLSIKSGRETIEALTRLFAAMRGRGVGGLAVWQATLSPAEQRELQLQQLRTFARQMPLNEAVSRTIAETDGPQTGDLQQEYTVEIRLSVNGSSLPDERPLGQSEQGRFLMQNAWRHGFIQRNPEGPGAQAYRFRYVGEAHATAMTYLDLNFESYLRLLHKKGVVTVQKDGKLRYIILCSPMEETHVEFLLPANAHYDASLDNMGYAVVACTLAE